MVPWTSGKQQYLMRFRLSRERFADIYLTCPNRRDALERRGADPSPFRVLVNWVPPAFNCPRPRLPLTIL